MSEKSGHQVWTDSQAQGIRNIILDPFPFPTRVELNESALDEALELQLISIRLQKSLIDDFKLIAKINGIGYQPLMRQILKRFADSEMKALLRECASRFEREEGLQTQEDEQHEKAC